MSTKLITPNSAPQNDKLNQAFFRGQAEHLKDYFWSSYDWGRVTVESYSPESLKYVEQTISKVQGYVPESVKEFAEHQATRIDSVIDSADSLVSELQQRGPIVAENCASLCSRKTLVEICSNSVNSGLEIVKEKSGVDVSEVCNKVLSKPVEIVHNVSDLAEQAKERVVNLAEDTTSKVYQVADETYTSVSQYAKDKVEYVQCIGEVLDCDRDGKISVKDLANCASTLTSDTVKSVKPAMEALQSKISLPELPQTSTKEVLDYVLANTQTKPLVEQVQKTLESMKSNEVFQPLWFVTNVLLLWATNVGNKASPLTPYLNNLVCQTAVVDLPKELFTVAASVFSGSENEVGAQTRELLWALLDVSILLNPTPPEVTTKNADYKFDQTPQMVTNKEALANLEWAKSLTGLNVV